MGEHPSEANAALLPCPACGTGAEAVPAGPSAALRCSKGHPAEESALSPAQVENLHAALRAALGILEERAQVAKQLAEQAFLHNRRWLAVEYEHKAWETNRHAALLKELLLRDGTLARTD